MENSQVLLPPCVREIFALSNGYIFLVRVPGSTHKNGPTTQARATLSTAHPIITSESRLGRTSDGGTLQTPTGIVSR